MNPADKCGKSPDDTNGITPTSALSSTLWRMKKVEESA
jgi:hypothetical protein